MNISYDSDEAVVTLRLRGSITGSAGRDLWDRIHDLVSMGHRGIVLEMGGVLECDPEGAFQLLRCVVLVERRGGVLGVVGLQSDVRAMLEDRQTIGAFTVFLDTPSALREIRRLNLESMERRSRQTTNRS